MRALYPALPIVLATGYASTSLEGRGLDKVVFIAKPYNLEKLRAALRSAGIAFPAASA